MPASPPPSRPLLAHSFLPAAVLVGAVLFAYGNSFPAPFLFDDISAIVENASIREWRTALVPPTDGSATTGRPVVNLTYALNHAVSGQAVWSYHALNLLIHAAATLALFGLVRRSAPGAPAFVIALLWAVHPLQTESVTCIAQRTESLCGLFYLLTLYSFARGVSSPRWLVVSVASCLLGMATKEVMVTAPLLVLLYDRTFVAGRFAAAWRARRGYYLALASTWVLLFYLVLGTGGTRGDAAGLGLGVSGWSYLLKQSEALVLYLQLSVWPHPLVVDYGGDVVKTWTEVWWQGPVVLALVAGTGWALVRRPVLGFLGAWFFVILAPSSSVVPLVSQTMAEHRMYLPLAAVLALLVGLAGRRFSARPVLVAGVILALAATGLTIRRNQVYQSELALWQDTLTHRPDNGRAHNNLGIALDEAGRIEEAAEHYREAARLMPLSADARLNLCHALVRLGRPGEAVPWGEAAVRLHPASAAARINLAAALAAAGRAGEAIVHLEEALRLQPGAADATAGLVAALYAEGNRSAESGDIVPALARYRRALELDPGYIPARNNLANVLLMTGQADEAIAHYQQILRQQPADAGVRENLERALEWQRSRR